MVKLILLFLMADDVNNNDAWYGFTFEDFFIRLAQHFKYKFTVDCFIQIKFSRA